MERLRVGVLFGGRSAEHDVSVVSMRKVVASLDPTRYQLVPIFIDRQGRFQLPSQLAGSEPFSSMLAPEVLTELSSLDVAFLALHGSYGEDGAMQGFLKTIGIPYIGCDLLASAIAMDKDMAKRLLRDSGLDVVPWMLLKRGDSIEATTIEEKLGFPVVVKPCSLGSTIGVSKVDSAATLAEAIATAFHYDHKILIEEAIFGREIECSLFGSNDSIRCSLPGELVLKEELHSYDSKYLPGASELLVPPPLPASEIERIQQTALLAYQVIGCEGLARVDFFYTEEGRLFVNELNTLPGLTPTSGYPQMWEASQVSFSHIVETLIELALERSRRDNSLSRERGEERVER